MRAERGGSRADGGEQARGAAALGPWSRGRAEIAESAEPALATYDRAGNTLGTWLGRRT